MRETENPKISIKRNNNPSSFMVDLSAMLREQEEILLEREKNVSFLNRSRQKIANAIAREEKEGEEVEAEDFFSAYEDKVRFIPDGKNSQEAKRKTVGFQDLAIVQSFKAFWAGIFSILKFIEHICFRTGWVLLFLVRFFYFFFLAIFRGIARFFAYFLPVSVDRPAKIWQEQYKEKEEPIFQSLIDPESVADYVLKNEEKRGAPGLSMQNVQSIGPARPIIQPEYKYCSASIPDARSSWNRFSGNQASLSVEPEESSVVNEDSDYEEASERTEARQSEAPLLPSRTKFSYLRATMYFTGLLLVLILPFKLMSYYGVLRELGGRVLGASEDAIGDIKNAGTSAGELDFYRAGEQFAAASDSFLKAQEEIEGISGELKILSSIIPSGKLKLAADADLILEAGELSAKIGQQISFMFDAFSSGREKSIKSVFNTFFENSPALEENTAKLHEILSRIDSESLPPEYQSSFITLTEKSGQIAGSFVELSELLQKMRLVLGFEGEKRYLLIFQNNSEMRGSGGFMGSFSIVDFRDGEIVKMETPKGGTYDVEAGYLDRIIAPEPLHIVNPLWHFWDANWWPDWKKTARKLMWFYEHSGGSSVDGVIAFTPAVAERLLSVIGPLDMEDSHGVTINSENFWEITQTFAEEKPIGHPDYAPLPFEPKATGTDPLLATTTDAKAPGQEPKKIIGDLLGEIKTELPNRLDKEVFLGLISALEQSLREKHVLFYFNDWELQSKFEELGWAGRVKNTAWDYLMIVNTNVSGGKSDRKIEQSISHQAELQPDGRIIDTVSVIRTHTGEKGEKFSGVKNLDWMRIYVPLGSEFISAEGFWPPDESTFEKPDPSWTHDPDLANSEENYIRDSISWTKIYNEDAKTVFANWVQVEPGQSVLVKIRYVLPFLIDMNSELEQPYALLLQKQPGAMPSEFESNFLLSGNLIPDWHYPENLSVSAEGWNLKEIVSEDRFYALILK